MKLLSLFLVLVGTLVAPLSAATAKPDFEKGDFAKYSKMAEAGDPKAMTAVGIMYHKGEDAKQDYVLAMDWYLKAIEKGDGDAFNNMGVLYRDGLGVEKNEKLAYLIFLAVHMEGMGNDDTQIRAGSNLERLVESLPKEYVHEALGYTWPYVIQLIKSKGKNKVAGPDVLPSKDTPRIRDNGWWLDSERAGMTFKSPPPWDKKGEIRCAYQRRKQRSSSRRSLASRKKALYR